VTQKIANRGPGLQPDRSNGI